MPGAAGSRWPRSADDVSDAGRIARTMICFAHLLVRAMPCVARSGLFTSRKGKTVALMSVIRIGASGRNLWLPGAMIALSTGCFQPPAELYARADFTYHRSVSFGGPDQNLFMDIMVPKAEAPRPVALLVHGGGWHLGGRSDMHGLAEALACLGYVSATIDYRLVPSGASFPDPVLDVIAAVQYARKHSDRYGIDPGRVALIGESSGGHLCLLVAYAHELFLSESGLNPYPGVSADVQAVVSLHGPTDMARLYHSNRFGPPPLSVIGFMGDAPDDMPEVYAKASPVTYARAGVPPTLLIHGNKDGLVPYSQSAVLYERLRAAGAPCRLATLPGASHPPVPLSRSDRGMRYLPVITHFLAQVFPEPIMPQE